MRSILDHPELETYYKPGWEVFTERDLLIGKRVILRPDRLQIRDGSAVILDYKTGKPRPEHREQLGVYAREISQMGFRLQRAVLVYIGEENVTLEEL